MSNVSGYENIRELIQNQLQWRYGTKVFDKSRLIPASDWKVLSETLRLSPSSFGLQPWRFLVVQSPTVRERLVASAPLNKSKIETASHIVVLARLKTVSVEYMDAYVKRMVDTRGVPVDSVQGFRDMIVKKLQGTPPEGQSQWSARQTYVALGSLLTSAAMMGIDACGMEGIDPAGFDEVLGLAATDYGTLVGVALGYRSADDKMQFAKKVRFDEGEVFTVI